MHEALRLIRIFHDIKASELASQLGISPSYLSEIEKGKKTITVSLLNKYSEIFEVPISTLMMFSENLESKGNSLKKIIGRKVIEVLGSIEEEGKKELQS